MPYETTNPITIETRPAETVDADVSRIRYIAFETPPEGHGDPSVVIAVQYGAKNESGSVRWLGKEASITFEGQEAIDKIGALYAPAEAQAVALCIEAGIMAADGVKMD